MHFLFDNEMHCHQIFSNLDTTNYIHLDYTAASISPGIIIMGYTHHNMQNKLHCYGYGGGVKTKTDNNIHIS